MELEAMVTQIENRQDLVEFISALRKDLEGNPGGWENPSLPEYLEAMGAWVQDLHGLFKNTGVDLSEHKPWRLFAEILLAAKIYE